MTRTDRPSIAWPRRRLPVDPFDGVDEGGFFVFVPAIMSVGIVFSIVTLVRDAFRWTGARARNRRTAIEANAVVRDLVGGPAISYRPPPALTSATGIAAISTVLITLVVAFAQDLTASIDEPIASRLADISWLDSLAPFDPFGSTLVTIAFVCLIGLSGFRCRVMAVVYPAAFAVAWLSIEILQHTIDRARPSGYEGFESFPSGHILQVVFIAGLLPVALDALSLRRRFIVFTRALLVVAAIATALHRIHLAKHWPLDVLGGFALGATIVLASHWVLEHRGWHRACAHCPWSTHPEPVPWQRGVIDLAPRTAQRTAYGAALLAVGAAAALGIATIWIGIPEDPEGSGLGSAISAPVQLLLAALMAIAGLLVLRWKAVAAMAMAIAAVGLGVFASVQYVPQLAFLLTAALLVPAVLTWFSWQPTASLGSIAAVAVLTASALTGTGLGVREVHEHYFGPTHPSSLTAPLDSHADWLWLGGVDDQTAVITAGNFAADTAVDVQYWETEDPAGTAKLLRVFADQYGLARFELQELIPATSYNYRVVMALGGRVEPPSSNDYADAGFDTFGQGAQDVNIAIGACARRASNGSVFDAIVAEDPDLYVALGDLHYGNLESNNPSAHIDEYARSLQQPAQAALFSSVPTAYVWDDHDYGPNDSDRDSPARTAVSTAYRAAVPSYGLDADTDAPIAQAFTIGRVRVIMTDTRSQRDATTMLGAAQLTWFLEELVQASATHALVIWANPTPWIGTATAGGDTWATYPEERALIAQTIADAAIKNVVMVSGDAHMVAIDDGSNSGYAEGGAGGFPVLHAAALDRPGSIKGGPYSHGAVAGGGQYGRLEITDDGTTTVSVRMSGHSWDGIELLALEVTIDVPGASAET